MSQCKWYDWKYMMEHIHGYRDWSKGTNWVVALPLRTQGYTTGRLALTRTAFINFSPLSSLWLGAHISQLAALFCMIVYPPSLLAALFSPGASHFSVEPLIHLRATSILWLGAPYVLLLFRPWRASATRTAFIHFRPPSVWLCCLFSTIGRSCANLGHPLERGLPLICGSAPLVKGSVSLL